METFAKLFAPTQIGKLEIKNRVVMAPMGTCLANENGAATDKLIDFYLRRAVGGVGLIIIENTSVTIPRSICRLNIENDHFITGLRELVEKVEENAPDCRLFIQLNQKAKSGAAIPYKELEPSSGKNSAVDLLSKSEIKDLVQRFVDAAVRAKKIGFAGIELHGGHYYIISQFLSPFYNHRSDEYGGNIEKNTQFALDIVERVREKVGPGYPLIFRQNGSDFSENGLSMDDAAFVARKLEKAGVDAIHVTAGIGVSPEWTGPPMGFAPGCFVHLAENIKRSVGIPVIAVGKINDPHEANRILEEGKADLIAMGRAFLADPEFLVKTKSGRVNEIRKCIACRYCNTDRVHNGFQIRCKINPSTGREREFVIRRTDHPKNIIVIGAGPAGMEAAYIAKKRGHHVKVLEREGVIGGQLLMAKMPPFKNELNDLVQFLETRLKKLEIPVRLNCSVNADLLKREKPDAIIMATGAKPFIKGIDAEYQKDFVTYREIFDGSVSISGKMVVIVGGGEIGCECGEFIHEHAKHGEVTIVEMEDGLAREMETVHRKLLLKRLAEKNIKSLLKTKFIGIVKEGVVVERENRQGTIAADMVVLAMGVEREHELSMQIRDLGIEHYEIGDCHTLGRIENAMLSAWQVALMI